MSHGSLKQLNGRAFVERLMKGGFVKAMFLKMLWIKGALSSAVTNYEQHLCTQV